MKAENVRYDDLSKGQKTSLQERLLRLTIKTQKGNLITKIYRMIGYASRGWVRVEIQVYGEKYPRRWYWYLGHWHNSTTLRK